CSGHVPGPVANPFAQPAPTSPSHRRTRSPGRTRRSLPSGSSRSRWASAVALGAEPGTAFLVRGGALLRGTPGGYDGRVARDPDAGADVLTPRPAVNAVAAGYGPVQDGSAGVVAGGTGRASALPGRSTTPTRAPSAAVRLL